MPGIIPNEGRLQIGAALLAWLDTCHVLIWTGPHVPVVGDTLSTYTVVEATFGGYARQIAGGWASQGIDANGNELLKANPLTFTSSGAGLPQTVTGYVLTDPSQTYAVVAEQATAPYTYTAAGQSLIVIPQLYLGALPTPF